MLFHGSCSAVTLPLYVAKYYTHTLLMTSNDTSTCCRAASRRRDHAALQEEEACQPLLQVTHINANAELPAHPAVIETMTPTTDEVPDSTRCQAHGISASVHAGAELPEHPADAGTVMLFRKQVHTSP